ncbi:hypothetical protein LTR84_006610 [Exophiala bonariae]|uniref:Dipeptidyl-peptidase V n=1 Tax=Exophiala bonariae TaxID=1690606 RepID=A0AAV9N3N8_9EURO|nr:hypothetical protein LTR84_006610 [Exophiala bonariae]
MPQGLLTAESLADIAIPEHLRISPDGKQVAYVLKPSSRSTEHPKSSIWIAAIGVSHSAIQITFGLFQDTQVEWTPDGNISFLSDRQNRGKLSSLFFLKLDSANREPQAISPTNMLQEIISYSWSPNGRYIAYLKCKEIEQKGEYKAKGGSNINVYGQNWRFATLRCFDIETGFARTIVEKESHVTGFSWDRDSSRIVYVTQDNPEPDSPGFNGSKFEQIELSTGHSHHVAEFPGPTADLVWEGTNIYFRAGVIPEHASTSWMTYMLQLDQRQWSKHAYGDDVCAARIRRSGCESVVVLVESGLHDQLHLNNKQLLYSGLHQIEDWDVRSINNDEHVIAFTRSAGGYSTQVFSVHAGDLCQLSRHNSFKSPVQVEPFYFHGDDGAALDGVFLTPETNDRLKSWPTVVIPHGGPYNRTTITFDVPYYHFGPWLASNGYAVLCPNYRGGSSHGQKHASAARGGMGTIDYSDIIAAVKTGISRQLIDPGRTIIAGWSQGGYHAYLAATRNDFPFRGAICGAGVTDLDMLVMTSCHPWYETDLAGMAPWDSDLTDTRNRSRSPTWALKKLSDDMRSGVNPMPILILHPENDQTVPVSQALSFHRGCLLHGIPCELVTYPDEDHVVEQRSHRIDMLERILAFCKLHLA